MKPRPYLKANVVRGHQTAMTRKKLSAPVQWLKDNDHLSKPGTDCDWFLLDHGCGRGTDAKILTVDEIDFDVVDKYDPYWHPRRPWFPAFLPEGHYQVILSTYVANVLPPQEVPALIEELQGLLTEDGVAFITVRRDLPLTGKPGRGCYQQYVTLDLPIVHETSSYCIYKLTKED